MGMGKEQFAVAPRKREGLKTGQHVWQYRHHLGGQSKPYNKRKIKVMAREAVLNVKSAFGQMVRPGEVSE